MALLDLVWTALRNLVPLVAPPLGDGTHEIEGLDGPIHIRLDTYGVPVIRAMSRRDAHYGAGFVCAQDRLLQLEVGRHVYAGRAAELLGDRPLPEDKFGMMARGLTFAHLDHLMRLFEFERWAGESHELASEQARALIDAAAAGINAFLEAYPRQVSLDVRLLGGPRRPWTGQDILVLLKGMAFEFNVSIKALIAQGRLTALLGGSGSERDARRLAELVPESPHRPAPYIVSEEALLERLGTLMGGGAAAGVSTGGMGSNSWALAGRYTESGGPLLANDPHMQLMSPGRLWEVCLETPEGRVGGAAIPGTGFVLIGRNDHVSWGFTLAMAHDTDLYWEALRRDEEAPVTSSPPGTSPLAARGPEAWAPVRQVRTIIKVRKGRPRLVTLRFTERGPLVSDAVHDEWTGRDEAARAVDVEGCEEVALSMRWTGLAAGREADALLQLNSARSAADASRALEDVSAPCLNMLIADRQGTIAYYMAGRLPRRACGPAPARPVPGWDGSYRWEGVVGAEELPRVENPAEGFLVTANNEVAPPSYPYYISRFYEPPYRAARIRELIEALIARGRPVTVTDLQWIQRDNLSIQARDLIGRVLRPLAADLDLPASGHSRWMVDQLLAWDYHCGAESIPAALFHVWYQALLWRTLRPRLGDGLFRQLFDLPCNYLAYQIDRLLQAEESAWFGDREAKARLVGFALVDAEVELTVRLGPERHRWTWGRLHRTSFPHLFSGHRLLGPLVRVGTFPGDASPFSVNQSSYAFSRPFDRLLGPAYRQVVDLGADTASGSVLPPGNSGHPASPHGRDQVTLWLEGQLKPHPYSIGVDPTLA